MEKSGFSPGFFKTMIETSEPSVLVLKTTLINLIYLVRLPSFFIFEYIKKRAFRLLLECRQTILKQNKLSDSAKNKIEFQYLNRFKKILKLSAVRKVPEIIMFQALGIIETLGSIISHGTSSKFADVRTHLRKVFDMTLS